MGKVLENIENVEIASNEILNRHTLNRNLKKLLDNDKALDELKQSFSLGQIKAYSSGYSYNKDDLVWYICISPKTGKNEIFLLRSMINDNIHTPEPKIVDGFINFEDSAWKDVFDLYTLLNNNFSSHVDSYIESHIETEHQYDEHYHKYGKLSENELSSKLLLSDISNIDKNRTYVHFPYKTYTFKDDIVVQNGLYRIWDCGLLEYNLIFKLGYTGNSFYINENPFDEVKCNNLLLDDSQLYNDEADRNIFNLSGVVSASNDYILINDVVEINHDKYVNSYSSQIDFPIPFIDTNYMVFSGDMRIEEHNTEKATIDQGQNALTYANKKTTSITPIYIVYQEQNIKNNYRCGLVKNNFQCQIVGRWK